MDSALSTLESQASATGTSDVLGHSRKTSMCQSPTNSVVHHQVRLLEIRREMKS